MLAVDISFLAVPNVISVAVSTAIYASTLSALGSLISSVLLLGQIRGLEIDSVKEGVRICSGILHPILNLFPAFARLHT
jgi:hypothetical protein